MNSAAIPRAFLQLRLRWMQRSFIARLAGAIVLLAVLLAGGLRPWLELQIANGQDDLHSARQALSTARALELAPKLIERPDDQRLDEWRQRLGYPHKTMDYIGRIYALANRQDLTIEQADYETTHDSASGLVTYRVRFESEAGYAALRQYCDEVLRRFPFISLDEFALERESVESDTLRAKIGLTLHLMTRPQ